MPRRLALLGTILSLLLLSACVPTAAAPDRPEASPSPPATSTSPVRTPVGGGPEPSINPTDQAPPPAPEEKTPMPPATPQTGANFLIDQARQDLAARLDLAVDDIELVSFEEVVWPDGGLGCPQPGMVYTQVPVDGALIRLRVAGTLYSYHSGGSRQPFLCE